jgi:glutaredoxin
MNQLFKILLLLAVIRFGWTLLNGSSVNAGSFSNEQIAQIATTVKAGDVVMYTTTGCGYCAQARQWLNQYRIAFTECNTDSSDRCARELTRYGGNGVPHLVVRGQHMREGFDSDQFLSILAAK